MSTTALPMQPPSHAERVDRETYRRLATRAKTLSWVSLAYMTLEGTVAIVAGVPRAATRRAGRRANGTRRRRQRRADRARIRAS